MMLLSLHPNTIVHVENVVSLFSSPSTSSQKVRKCGGHNFLSELEQNQFDHYTHPCVPTVYACEFLVAYKYRKYPGITFIMYEHVYNKERLCGMWGVAGGVWLRLLPWGRNSALQSRLESHLNFIFTCDWLVRAEGGVASAEREDLEKVKKC